MKQNTLGLLLIVAFVNAIPALSQVTPRYVKNIYTIRNGEDLSALLRKEGRVIFPTKCDYTAEVRFKAVVNPQTSKLYFAGVDQSAYYPFTSRMKSVSYPYVYIDKLERDTLFFTFDFSSLLRKKERREKIHIESYSPPQFDGEEVPHKWMSKFLGSENCEKLYYRKVKSIRALIDVDSMGRAFVEMLYSRVEIDMSRLNHSKELWTPTIINGQSVTLSNEVTFIVSKLLSEEQRACIDNSIEVDESGKIFNSQKLNSVDQTPLFRGSEHFRTELKKWLRTEIYSMKLAGKLAWQSSEKKGIESYSRWLSRGDEIELIEQGESYEYSVSSTKPVDFLSPTTSKYIERVSERNLAYAISYEQNLGTQGAVTSSRRYESTGKASFAPSIRVSFVVGADGLVESAKVVNSPNNELSAVAIKLIESSSGMWSPAIHEGKYVKCKLVADVDFRD